MLYALCILILGSLFIDALITPSIYCFIKYLLPQINIPYSRVFDRVLMITLLVFLIILKKHFSVKEAIEKFKEFKKKIIFRDFLVAFFISLGISVFLVFFLDFDDKLVWVKKDSYYYITKISKAFFSAIIISVLEESFFRVILFNAFKKKCNFYLAVIVTSLCYASAHFIAPQKAFTFSKLSLGVGFSYYIEVIKTMLFPNILNAFFGLFLVGFVLCLIIQRFNSIYINIGLHSGWVMAMKLFIYSTGEAPSVVMNPMYRRYFLVTEPLGWFSILLVLAVTFALYSRFKNYKNMHKSSKI